MTNKNTDTNLSSDSHLNLNFNTNLDRDFNTDYKGFINYAKTKTSAPQNIPAAFNDSINATDIQNPSNLSNSQIHADSQDSTDYFNFNTAESINSYDLIPANTLAKVSLHIKKGLYCDHAKGLSCGYPTLSRFTGALYLACEFTVIEGKYAKRKIWSNIGIHSDKNNNRWGDMGRSFIKSIINSAKGLTSKDQSDSAKNLRRIKDFSDLEGLEFAAKIQIEKDDKGLEQNVIKSAITPEHKEYERIMNKRASFGNRDANNIVKPDWA